CSSDLPTITRDLYETRFVEVACDGWVDRVDRIEADRAVEMAVELDFRQRAKVHWWILLDDRRPERGLAFRVYVVLTVPWSAWPKCRRSRQGARAGCCRGHSRAREASARPASARQPPRYSC